MSELSREQVEIIAGKIRNEYIWKHEVNYWLGTDAALRATITQQAQELEQVKKERDAFQVGQLEVAKFLGYGVGAQLSLQSFIMQQLAASQARCREMEEKYVHQDLLLDEQDKLAQLQATLAAREAEVAELKGNHCKDCCCARSWEALEVTGPTGMSIVEHIERLKAERDAAVQEAGRVKEAVSCLTCEVCKMDMQRALKGA